MNEELGKCIQTFERVLSEIPELVYAGNKVLRESVTEVSLEEGVEIAEKLKEVLLKYRNITGFGRGLAAPQVGESKSVFVTYVDDQFQIFINSKITERAKASNFYKELCMSVGVVAADVQRPEWIVMEWTDESGELKSEKFEGFKARLLQHEEAHLRGRLNIDDAVEGGIELFDFDPLKEQLRS